MDSCEARDPSPFVLSGEGAAIQKRVYSELLAILEGVQPGISKKMFETTQYRGVC